MMSCGLLFDGILDGSAATMAAAKGSLLSFGKGRRGADTMSGSRKRKRGNLPATADIVRVTAREVATESPHMSFCDSIHIHLQVSREAAGPVFCNTSRLPAI
ncbi:hypothetical protein KC19_VG251600 [Ceratodon purpureus]|uniref:Uncharacterized protein n=1 Tax=Ceratodon purpureus TaxID=3225 RepID=A0A8T0HU81_CERPU|nr:hypothetical protein KC19_VG251600 [Ceratodon purpureus]